MRYALTGHVHEREVSRRLGHAVEFMPHVAPHFRGITLTANLHLSRPVTLQDVQARYAARYANEPLVRMVEEAPWVSRSEEHTSELQSLMRISYAVSGMTKQKTTNQR